MNIGILYGLVAAISWAIANVSIKACTERFGSWGSLLWTQLIGGVIVVVLAFLINGAPPALSADDWLALIVSGFAAVIAYGGLFEALKKGQVTIVIPIIASWAVISVVVAAFRFGEPLTMGVGIGTAVVVACNVLLARSSPEVGPAETPKIALFFAALSAIGFGILAPMVDYLGSAVGGWWTIPLIWGTELALIVPVYILWKWRGNGPDFLPNNTAEFWLAGKVSLFETLGFVAMSIGMTLAPVGVVAPVSSLATGLTVLLGIYLLKEKVNARIIIGAAGASIGVVLVNL